MAAKKIPADARDKAKQVALDTILKKTGHKPVGYNSTGFGYVPTGSFVVDNLIGGSLTEDGKRLICPGFPRKHYTEIFGAESSGKTTACLQAIAEVQKQGGRAYYIDFENAVDHRYAKRIGVKFDKSLDYFVPTTFEDGMWMIYSGIKTGVDIVVVDSIAAMTTKTEMEKDFSDPAVIGDKARQLSRNLPKINSWLGAPPEVNPLGTALVFVNQVRALIGNMGHGDNDTTPGGKALKFYAHLRLKYTKIKTESRKVKDKVTGKDRTTPYGNHVQVKVVKSRIDAKQGHTGDIFIRYGIGVDDILTLITGCQTNKLISVSGSIFDIGGQKFKGKEDLRRYLLNNEKTATELRKKLLEVIRMADIAANVGDDGDDDDEADDGFELVDSPDPEADEPGAAAPEEVVVEEDTGED
jgi:recombination protein RecA